MKKYALRLGLTAGLWLAMSNTLLLAEEDHAPAAAAAPQVHAVHWGYEGEGGPEHWGELQPDYATCATGKNQSPINLTGFIESELPPLKFSYQAAGGHEILNNGHTIQVNFNPGNEINLNGQIFTLKQFHIHAPSENQLQGASFPMEAHLVHADAQGHLAVVAIFIKEGAANLALNQAWPQIPEKANDKVELKTPVAAAALLPANRDYYRFNGSLTTPPCTEGVIWLVMKSAMTASKAQISRFKEVMHHANNRPIQPLNARTVLQ